MAQQTATVSSLSTHLGVVSEKLIGTMSNSRNNGNNQVSSDPSTAASIGELSGQVKSVVEDLAGVKAHVGTLESSLSDLKSLAKVAGRSESAISPPGTPGSATPTPGTKPIAIAMAVELVTPGGGPDVDAQRMLGQLNELQESLTSVRTEFRTDSGALRREWHKAMLDMQQRFLEQRGELGEREALSDMQQRFLEQRGELGEREAKIKQLRELAIQEEQERRIRCAFEDKACADIERVATALELMQAKVDEVQEQLLYLQNNHAE
eukprot:gene22060-29125_t